MAASRHGKRVKGLVLVSGYYFRPGGWRGSASRGRSCPAIPGGALVALARESFLGEKRKAEPTWNRRNGVAQRTADQRDGSNARDPDVKARACPTLSKKSIRAILIRPSQLCAVAEDSAFMLPSAATLTMAYRRLKWPTAIIPGRDDEIVDSEQALSLPTPPLRSYRKQGTWCIISWRSNCEHCRRGTSWGGRLVPTQMSWPDKSR
jgi:pimeloyl-ACP methyl ester carboxylesterase